MYDDIIQIHYFWGGRVCIVTVQRNRIAIEKFASHIVQCVGCNISLITPLIELSCCRHFQQRNTMQNITKATENWPRQDIATLFDDMGSFHDDDAPLAKLLRSFHCQRVKNFK